MFPLSLRLPEKGPKHGPDKNKKSMSAGNF